jgi:hypothetical protein
MTFASSGTQNAVQAALVAGLSAAQVATWIAYIPSSFPITPVSITNYPASLQHGALEADWPDQGLINEFNVIWNQCNYQYRI